MSVIANVAELLEEELQAAAREGRGGQWAAPAEAALAVVRDNARDLQELGEDGLIAMLRAITEGQETTSAVALLQERGAAAIVADMEAGTDALIAETERRQRAREAGRRIAQQLGRVGARFLLALIV